MTTCYKSDQRRKGSNMISPQAPVRCLYHCDDSLIEMKPSSLPATLRHAGSIHQHPCLPQY